MKVSPEITIHTPRRDKDVWIGIAEMKIGPDVIHIATRVPHSFIVAQLAKHGPELAQWGAQNWQTLIPGLFPGGIPGIPGGIPGMPAQPPKGGHAPKGGEPPKAGEAPQGAPGGIPGMPAGFPNIPGMPPGIIPGLSGWDDGIGCGCGDGSGIGCVGLDPDAMEEEAAALFGLNPDMMSPEELDLVDMYTRGGIGSDMAIDDPTGFKSEVAWMDPKRRRPRRPGTRPDERPGTRPATHSQFDGGRIVRPHGGRVLRPDGNQNAMDQLRGQRHGYREPMYGRREERLDRRPDGRPYRYVEPRHPQRRTPADDLGRFVTANHTMRAGRDVAQSLPFVGTAVRVARSNVALAHNLERGDPDAITVYQRIRRSADGGERRAARLLRQLELSRKSLRAIRAALAGNQDAQAALQRALLDSQKGIQEAVEARYAIDAARERIFEEQFPNIDEEDPIAFEEYGDEDIPPEYQSTLDASFMQGIGAGNYERDADLIHTLRSLRYGA